MWRHIFIQPLKLELSVGHVGRIYAVPNNERNRTRLNKALVTRDTHVRLCEDGSTLVTVRKELPEQTQTCEECGACIPVDEWPEGEPCPVCSPYWETGYEA